MQRIEILTLAEEIGYLLGSSRKFFLTGLPALWYKGITFGKGIKMDQLQKTEFGFGYYYWFYYAEVCPTPGS